MSDWTDFLSITKELDELVHRPIHEKNRAAIVEQVDVLLDKREAMLRGLPQPSPEEKELVQQIIQSDLKVNQKLEFLFDGLKRDMRNMKKQKASKQRYTNPYKSVSGYDGTYVDHKK
ncbi:flagellar protein FliT [Halobacillus litoralis]|uniref:Flagellar protein FliT n=1 Tax=Halobacillus litoralis TaxID=45668 RepID=A0A845E4L4_9BACI|nr:flagellar protein FliT [Halobacillus litoralis]MYL49169.1 flagellar protein FliT [Halobacillus litoralis]